MPFLPGDIVSHDEALVCGVGTYLIGGVIRASLSGRCVVEGGAVSIQRDLNSTASSLVPEIGQLVLARVLRISPLVAYCELLLCEGKPTAAHSGVVRREHVREGEVDTVKMEECFLPGDIIQAVVASLGDSRSFFLTTKAVHCGVVAGKAEVSGNPLRAASVTEMEDVESGVREKRKVAIISE